jgi:cation transport ATPase
MTMNETTDTARPVSTEAPEQMSQDTYSSNHLSKVYETCSSEWAGDTERAASSNGSHLTLERNEHSDGKGDCCNDDHCCATKDLCQQESDHTHSECENDDKTECCSMDQPCICDSTSYPNHLVILCRSFVNFVAGSCEEKYVSLLHQQSGCKRTNIVTAERQLSNASESNPTRRFSCAHCLKSARTLSLSSGARACYCKLTRTLSRSLKSLAAVEFSSGCCGVGARMRSYSCGDCHDDHDHDHDHDHGHGHRHDHSIAHHHSKTEAVIPEESSNISTKHETTDPPAGEADLEEGSQYTRHLALGVSGMHCSTCADDIAKILQKISGVDSQLVKVSFIMSRAELDYDPKVVQDVDLEIRRKVLRGFPRLDIMVLADSKIEEDDLDGIMKARVGTRSGRAETLRCKLEGVAGVRSAVSVNSQEVDFLYDPDVVGIRDILSSLRHSVEFKGNADDVVLRDVPDGAAEAQRSEAKQLRSIAIQTILAATFTIPCLVFAWSGDTIKIDDIRRYSVECGCATAVVLVAYRIYLDACWALLHNRSIDMNVLVAVATGAAYLFSIVIFVGLILQASWTKFADMDPFFETSCLLTTLILAGRWMTAGVRSWASKKIRTVGDGGELQSKFVRFFDSESGQELEMDARELHYGDVILVSQNEKVVTDGLVIGGTAQTDESHLTGEPKPQTKIEGSYLLAGSKVVSGSLRYQVSRLVQENTISKIKNMVKLASQQKPKAQEIADKIATILTPSILVIATVVFLIWLFVGALRMNLGWGQSSIKAATYAIATLAISCPCAIGLAVPMVLVVASYVGVSKGGFVFKNPAAVERGRKIGKVIFDKTGTLTTGHLRVEASWILSKGRWEEKMPEADLRAVVRTLCKASNHPVAKAMYRFFGSASPASSSTTLPSDIKVTTIVSKGVEASIDGLVYRGGRLRFTAPEAAKDPGVVDLLSSVQSVFTISRDSHLIAIFSLRDDTIRPEVSAVLEQLRARNIELYIFSGDRPEAVFPVASDLGIPRSNVFADCYPEDKRGRLEALKNTSHSDELKAEGTNVSKNPGDISKLTWYARFGRRVLFHRSSRKTHQSNVMFVGDGTNDAVALMAADVGISLSQSADMAANSADVVIVSDSIIGLLGFLNLCQRISLCVRLNFAWALLWNLFAILGASGAWVNVRIAPEYAGLGEIGSVLPVFIISWAVGWGYRNSI